MKADENRSSAPGEDSERWNSFEATEMVNDDWGKGWKGKFTIDKIRKNLKEIREVEDFFNQTD